jgi:hypothetical protein
MKPRCAHRSLRAETNVRSFGLLSGFVYVRGACLCLRSHATFFGITRPSFTSARVLPSFGSTTPTSAGSAVRNPQKFATSLYLNAALRTAFGVTERCGFAIREWRTGADDDSRYGEGAGEGAGNASTLGSSGMLTGVSYGYGPGTLMLGIAESIFWIGRASRTVSPVAIPIIPISVEPWVLFKFEQSSPTSFYGNGETKFPKKLLFSSRFGQRDSLPFVALPNVYLLSRIKPYW